MMGLVFSLNDSQRYVIPISDIREVVVSQSLSHMPGSHPCVSGIFHLRGMVIPVIDTSTLVQGRPLENTISTKTVICEVGDDLFGLEISEALLVRTFEDSERRSAQQGSAFVSDLWLCGEAEAQSVAIELNARSLFLQVNGELDAC